MSFRLFNLSHLDHLGEEIQRGDSTLRIVHIYSEAPDYNWVGDDDEGIACVDDAARAAVVYLRHFELSNDQDSREKATELLRFIMYMQRRDGLFYNFVWNNQLEINRTHQNSRAEPFGWWASRAVWALGMGARVLNEVDPPFARLAEERIQRTYPHLGSMLEKYGQYSHLRGRTVPRWLVMEAASDATSELLLGLIALNRAFPDTVLDHMITRFAEGIASMQYGSMNEFPFGLHASWPGIWHGWGNSQTQALAPLAASAVHEADHFYPRLLILGWLHSLRLDDPDHEREFEQIAYAVRGVAVGLVRLFEATGDIRYAEMAGLAASWFTGNNAAGFPMYDPETGRGFDGIISATSVNRNAGAESTIESLFSILEVERIPAARRWLGAVGDDPVYATRKGNDIIYRIFSITTDSAAQRLGLIMNLTDESLTIIENDELDRFLAN